MHTLKIPFKAKQRAWDEAENIEIIKEIEITTKKIILKILMNKIKLITLKLNNTR